MIIYCLSWLSMRIQFEWLTVKISWHELQSYNGYGCDYYYLLIEETFRINVIECALCAPDTVMECINWAQGHRNTLCCVYAVVRIVDDTKSVVHVIDGRRCETSERDKCSAIRNDYIMMDTQCHTTIWQWITVECCAVPVATTCLFLLLLLHLHSFPLYFCFRLIHCTCCALIGAINWPRRAAAEKSSANQSFCRSIDFIDWPSSVRKSWIEF